MINLLESSLHRRRKHRLELGPPARRGKSERDTIFLPADHWKPDRPDIYTYHTRTRLTGKRRSMRFFCVVYVISVVFCFSLLGSESFVLSAQMPSSRQANRVSTIPIFSQRGGDEEQDESPLPNSTPPKNHIEVTNHIHLPFSAEVAYDAFSDLPRQAAWSPWLKSVAYVKEGSNETKWTMRSVLGVSYSWNAISTRLERPRIIEWESCRGLKNWGRVEFTPISVDSSYMQLTLTFVAPRVLARFFQNKEGGLSRMVQKRIIGRTLRSFLKVVLEEDVANSECEVNEQDLVSLGAGQERS